jgi:hypothetical protein
MNQMSRPCERSRTATQISYLPAEVESDGAPARAVVVSPGMRPPPPNQPAPSRLGASDARWSEFVGESDAQLVPIRHRLRMRAPTSGNLRGCIRGSWRGKWR